MRQVVCSAALIAALACAGCGKKDTLAAKVEAVYTPAQVLVSDRRLGAQAQSTSVPLPDGDMFLVIASRITNPTNGTQRFDQNKVQVVDEYDNTFSRIGLTVDCGEAASVMEYNGTLEKLALRPGQTLAGDAQVTCFIFTVPVGDRRFSLRVPGAPDTPAPLPARRTQAGASASPATAVGARRARRNLVMVILLQAV
jgi:hypothetical protein